MCILNRAKIYQHLKTKESEYTKNIDKVANFAKGKLALIIKVFESYTNHDIEHSINVMDYMFSLIDNPSLISDEVFVLIIYSALFHDIGMALTDEEIEIIKNSKKPSDNDLGIDFVKVLKNFNNDTNVALRAVIRDIHGKRSASIITDFAKIPENNNLFNFYQGDAFPYDFKDLLAKICESHIHSVDWIKKYVNYDIPLTNEITINGKYVAYLLRIADLLDFDCDRAPYFYNWINYIEPSSQQYHYINQIIAPGEKIYPYNESKCSSECKKIGQCGKSLKIIKVTGRYLQINTLTPKKKDELYGQCLEYFENTEKEIERVLEASESWKESIYKIKLCSKIASQIYEPEHRMICSPKKFIVEYPLIRDLFLGENVYKDKKIGLRELLQNSYDACIEMKETYLEIDRIPYEYYIPVIHIMLDKNLKTIKIQDNGVGMSLHIITDCFLHIGKSLYDGNKYRYTSFHNNHIGHYGFGFFATFMLSSEVEVKTRYFDKDENLIIRISRFNEYVIISSRNVEGTKEIQGTTITLDYDEFMNVFSSKEFIKRYITENFLDCGIKIYLSDETDTRINNENSLINFKQFGSINLDPNHHQNQDHKIDLGIYLKNVMAIAHFSNRNINNSYGIMQNNYLFDGSTFVLANDKDFSEFLNSCNNDIIYLKIFLIHQFTDCNFFVPEKMLIDGALPFGFNGQPMIIILSNPNRPIYKNVIVNDLPKIINTTEEISPKAVIQKLNVLKSTNDFIYYTKNFEFKKDARKHLVYCTCGETERNDTIYVRNVLVPNFHVTIPYIMDDYDFTNLNCNILTENIYPTMDRLDVSESICNDFSYAIGKAIMMYLRDNETNVSKKQKIDTFINNFYFETNHFLQ